MDNKKKRTQHQHSTPLQLEPHKKLHQQRSPKRLVFTTYQDVLNLQPKVKLLCEIIATTPSSSVETLLEDTGLRVSQDDVVTVLKLSYAFPGPALKFFRWSSHQLVHQHSTYAWNLGVDILGKNGLFEVMWAAVRSMKVAGLISLATFASIFSSYATYDHIPEALLSFEVMEQYGCPKDVLGLNSLMSALCREGKTVDAVKYLLGGKHGIEPDVDTYAILLEGWEKEGNVEGAKQTFANMVAEIGWDPKNVPAYDSFLRTLLRGPDGMSAVVQYLEKMKDRKCYPGMKFFSKAVEDCFQDGDVRGAGLLWETLTGEIGFRPDIQMCNSMIALCCRTDNTDMAKRMLDEMVYKGVFPDTESYNVLFQSLIKSKKLKEASALFSEMVKNECFPSQENCYAAVRNLIRVGDPYVAIKIWKFIVDNYDSDLQEIGNFLVVGLLDVNFTPEAIKHAEVMIEKGIKLNSSSLSKLKQGLRRVGNEFVYEELLRKWKAHEVGRSD